MLFSSCSRFSLYYMKMEAIDCSSISISEISSEFSQKRTWDDLMEHMKILFWELLVSDIGIEAKEFLVSKYGEALVLHRCSKGKTALHWAVDEDSARLLLEALSEGKRSEYLCAVSQRGRTALHSACHHNRLDVVQYLLSFGVDEHNLQLVKDKHGYTALHRTKTRAVAETLVNSVHESNREKYVRAITRKGWTAFRVAVRTDRTDNVEYFLTLKIDDDKMLLMKDNYGLYVFPCCRSRAMAEILFNAIKAQDRETVLHNTGNKGNVSVLYLWSMLGRTELVEYILSLDVGSADSKAKFICGQNLQGNTALHAACLEGHDEVVCCFLFADMPTAVRTQLLLTKDRFEGRTVLSCCTKKETVEMLLSCIDDETREELLNTADKSNETPLHVFCFWGQTDIVEYLLSEWLTFDHLLVPGQFFDTPFHLAFQAETTSTVSMLLERYESNSNQIKRLLTHKNGMGRNAYHLAGANKNFADFSVLLWDHLDLIDFREVFTPDLFGNNPIHFFTGAHQTVPVADLLMRLSLEKRRDLLVGSRNTVSPSKVNCREIAMHTNAENIDIFFNENVIFNTDVDSAQWTREATIRGLNMDRDWRGKYLYDIHLPRIIMYALNEYPLTDAISYLPTSTQKINGWVFIDDHLLSATESRRAVQRKLENLDTPELHGLPKVVIRRRSDRKYVLHPPGPDFMIVTACVRESLGDDHSSFPEESLPVSDVNETVEALCNQDYITHVSVNSTLGRHFGDCRSQPTSDDILIYGKDRGKALIICNKIDREDWEIQYSDAKFVVEEQLGLQVMTQFDLTGVQMTEEISKFMKSLNSDPLVALIVICHGDGNGNISGVDNQSIPVQVLINSMHTGEEVGQKIKLVMLSFCRGQIQPGYNRIGQSFESKVLAPMVGSALSPVKRELPAKLKKSEHKSHPFPDVDVPVDCYLQYSTLPDSKSPQDNILFKVMRSYLSELTQPRSAAAAWRPNRVALIDLFIDVAGLVRDKSQFKIYTNYCYTINKHSKRVLIDILKAE